MREITVTVREMDWNALEALAEREWRTPPQQASAIVETALARARANTAPRGASRRTPARNNGAIRDEV